MSSFYTENELSSLGLRSCGRNVLISRNASLYGAENICIGDNVRVDDFCILSGRIRLEGHNHIAAGVYLFAGSYGITLCEFANISSRSAVYAVTDDYAGLGMTGPTVPDRYRVITGGPVTLERHVLIGTGCTILPGVTIGEGSSVGSMSLVSKSLEPWGMYVGIPCKRLHDRSDRLLKLEQQFRREQADQP